MGESKVKGKILRNDPVTFDEDRVYDQIVFIELSNGSILYLFDPDMISTDEMVGKVKTLGIRAFISRVEKLSVPKKGVESQYQSSDDTVSISKGPIIFFGEITDINEDAQDIFVDIGGDTIVVDLCWDERLSFGKYKIADYVCIKPGRLDLFAVSDEE